MFLSNQKRVRNSHKWNIFGVFKSVLQLVIKADTESFLVASSTQEEENKMFQFSCWWIRWLCWKKSKKILKHAYDELYRRADTRVEAFENTKAHQSDAWACIERFPRGELQSTEALEARRTKKCSRRQIVRHYFLRFNEESEMVEGEKQ